MTWTIALLKAQRQGLSVPVSLDCPSWPKDRRAVASGGGAAERSWKLKFDAPTPQARRKERLF